MCRTFTHYKSISYSDKSKDFNKLKKKRTQAVKIVQITNSSSHVTNYTKTLMHNFYIKAFVFFFSGMFSSLVSNFFDFHIEKFSIQSGLGEKIKIIKVKEEEIM